MRRMIFCLLVMQFAGMALAASADDEAMKKLQQAAEYSLHTNFIATMRLPSSAVDLADEIRYYRRPETNGKASERLENPFTQKSLTPGKRMVYVWGKFGCYAITPAQAVKLTGEMEKNASIPNLLNSYYCPSMLAESYDFVFGRDPVRHQGVECYEIQMRLRTDLKTAGAANAVARYSFLIGKERPFIYAAVGYDRNGAELNPHHFLQTRLTDVQLEPPLDDALFRPAPDDRIVTAATERQYHEAVQKQPVRPAKRTLAAWTNLLWSHSSLICVVLGTIGVLAVLLLIFLKIKEKVRS